MRFDSSFDDETVYWDPTNEPGITFSGAPMNRMIHPLPTDYREQKTQKQLDYFSRVKDARENFKEAAFIPAELIQKAQIIDWGCWDDDWAKL